MHRDAYQVNGRFELGDPAKQHADGASLVTDRKNELGEARTRRLAEIVQIVSRNTPRPADMPEAVFQAMVRRIAMNQLVDEELRPDRAEDESA